MNIISNAIPIQACDYGSSYTAIYDSNYGPGFVFVDEDELCSNDNEPSYLPLNPASGFFKGQQRRNILQIVIAKA